MSSKHTFEFGNLEVTTTHAVITCNGEVNIDFNEVETVQDVLYTVFSGKKFGLIANRVNTYSVNPLAIKGLFTSENLVAGAIVDKTRIGKINAELESKIITGAQIKHFLELESAVKWIEDTVSDCRDAD